MRRLVALCSRSSASGRSRIRAGLDLAGRWPRAAPFSFGESDPVRRRSAPRRSTSARPSGRGGRRLRPGPCRSPGRCPAAGKVVTIETDGRLLGHAAPSRLDRGPKRRSRSRRATRRDGRARAARREFATPYVHLGIRRTSDDPDGYVDPLSLLPAPRDVPPVRRRSGSGRVRSRSPRRRRPTGSAVGHAGRRAARRCRRLRPEPRLAPPASTLARQARTATSATRAGSTCADRSVARAGGEARAPVRRAAVHSSSRSGGSRGCAVDASVRPRKRRAPGRVAPVRDSTPGTGRSGARCTARGAASRPLLRCRVDVGSGGSHGGRSGTAPRGRGAPRAALAAVVLPRSPPADRGAAASRRRPRDGSYH